MKTLPFRTPPWNFGNPHSPLVWLVFAFVAFAGPLVAFAQELPERARDPRSQQTVFLRPKPVTGAKKFASAAQASAAAQTISASFLETYAQEFGILSPAQDLQLASSTTDELGMTHLKYGHFHNGLPVIGSSLAVYLSLDGQVSYANGRIAQGLAVDTTPTLTSDQASMIASARWQQQFGETPTLDETTLLVFQPALLGIGDTNTYLVWRIPVSSPSRSRNDDYLLDARTGDLRHVIPRDWRAVKREIYDCSNNGASGCSLDVFDAGLSYTFGRSEGQPARGANPPL